MFVLLCVVFGQSTAANRYDFRIVVDVTGSMKQNDPSNLRIPALRLVNGLIPQGSKAGIWTLGRYVDASVRWGKVDAAWRKAADRAAEQLHSNGRFTNIEKALTRSTIGWDKPDRKTRRIVLLLTDGQIKISNSSAKNEKSRAAVLGKMLASLKARGIRIFSIALSNEADQVLLRRLASETGGSFIFTKAGGELQKTLFTMMERIYQPDLIALDGNEFPVEASVQEMTLVIFRSADSPPTQLIPPGSPMITAQQPAKSIWRSDRGYELIKIPKPVAGNWRIVAEPNPHSRLMVLTDLKLKVSGLPRTITPLAGLTVAAELYKQNRKIRKYSQLRFVKFQLTHINIDGTKNTYPMKPTSILKDKGQYLFRGSGKLSEGTHSFIVSAESESYKRSKRFDVEVRWPVEVVIEPGIMPGVYELSLRGREEYLKPDSLVARVEIEAPDGTRSELRLQSSPQRLHAKIETNQAGQYQAHIMLSAISNNSKPVELNLGSFPMDGVFHDTAEAVSVSTND